MSDLENRHTRAEASRLRDRRDGTVHLQDLRDGKTRSTAGSIREANGNVNASGSEELAYSTVSAESDLFVRQAWRIVRSHASFAPHAPATASYSRSGPAASSPRPWSAAYLRDGAS